MPDLGTLQLAMAGILFCVVYFAIAVAIELFDGKEDR